MGANGPGRGAREALPRSVIVKNAKACRVIVDRPVWKLDRPLSYLIPEKYQADVQVGSIVRVPLRGPRVRGWVVDLCDDADGASEDIAAVSGRAPVFDQALLHMARALARQYLHPLSTFLRLFTPPQMGRRRIESPARTDARPGSTLRLEKLQVQDDVASLIHGEIETALGQGRGAIVVTPYAHERSHLLDSLKSRYGDRAVLVHSNLSQAERAGALWKVAEGSAQVVLGGRSALFTAPFALGKIIVNDEGNRLLKSQSSPFHGAREVAVQRARACGASLVLLSRTPSLNAIALSHHHAPFHVEDPKAWPAMEVVGTERQGISRRAVAAIIDAAEHQEKSVIVLPRMNASRAGPGVEDTQVFLRRVMQDSVRRVMVGTEGLVNQVEPGVQVVVAAGVDSHLRRATGRAAEELVGLLWRMAALLNKGGRMFLETDDPENHVVRAVQGGDYNVFVERETQLRRQYDAPPFTTFIKVRSADPLNHDLVSQLEGMPQTIVLGPMQDERGFSMLIKAVDRPGTLDQLGSIASMSKQKVFVEVDPRDW